MCEKEGHVVLKATINYHHESKEFFFVKVCEVGPKMDLTVEAREVDKGFLPFVFRGFQMRH